MPSSAMDGEPVCDGVTVAPAMAAVAATPEPLWPVPTAADEAPSDATPQPVVVRRVVRSGGAVAAAEATAAAATAVAEADAAVAGDFELEPHWPVTSAASATAGCDVLPQAMLEEPVGSGKAFSPEMVAAAAVVKQEPLWPVPNVAGAAASVTVPPQAMNGTPAAAIPLPSATPKNLLWVSFRAGASVYDVNGARDLQAAAATAPTTMPWAMAVREQLNSAAGSARTSRTPSADPL